MCSAILRRGEFISIRIHIYIYIYILEFIYIILEQLFPVIYSFIYLYQYEFLNSYFIFCAIIQYYFSLLLKLFHLWLLGALPYFLVQRDVPDSSCAILIPEIELVINTRSFGSFQQRRVFRTKAWALGTSIVTGMSYLGPLSAQSQNIVVYIINISLQ